MIEVRFQFVFLVENVYFNNMNCSRCKKVNCCCKSQRGPRGPKGDPGKDGGKPYMYDTYYAASDAYVQTPNWVDSLFAIGPIEFTSPRDGVAKVTIDIQCVPEDPGARIELGIGLNGNEPVGSYSLNPFISQMIDPTFNGCVAHLIMPGVQITDKVKVWFRLADNSTASMGIATIKVLIEWL